jgi:lipopolysaccharide assembly outer membrane protein LptD (OstA)
VIQNQTSAYELNADNIEFHEKDQLIIATGNVNAIINQYQIKSNNCIYNLKNKKIELYGDVKITDTVLGNRYQSKDVTLDLINNTIKIQDVSGKLKNAKVSAKSITYNDTLYESKFITMSLCDTCKRGQKILPFWKIRAKKLTVDMIAGNEIKLQDVYFDILDKQVGYMQSFSLPTLWNKGKTGFMMPNLQNKGLGYQLDIPLYWKTNDNLDFTFYPAIGKKIIYGLNMRYKVENGGYETSIYTGSLPFLKGNYRTNTSIFRAWPANIKMNTNLLFPFQKSDCKELHKASEVGINGEFALGAKPILLYKYDISNKRILVGNVYMNTVYNSTFGSINMLNLHNLRLDSRTIALPKTNIYNIHRIELENNLFSTDPLMITHISTNNIHNETFKEGLSDALGEIKLITKHYLGAHNKITYVTQLTGYTSAHKNLFYTHNKPLINTALDIHWESKIKYNQKIIEPHLVLHLEPSTEPFFSVNQLESNNYTDSLSIYSTTNNLHPYNIFGNGMYSAGKRSIMQKNGHHIDYGLIFSAHDHRLKETNKLFTILGSRQYLTKPSRYYNLKPYNQDLSLAMIQDNLKEKYVLQIMNERESLSITNRTWFTDNLNILNNEFYLNKDFTNLSTKIQYLFLNSKYNFNQSIKQNKFERFLKLKLKYNLSENWSLGGWHTIKFGQNIKGYNVTRPGHLRGKLEYSNECIQMGFTVKKDFNSGRKNSNDNVSSYNFYVKIPTI